MLRLDHSASSSSFWLNQAVSHSCSQRFT